MESTFLDSWNVLINSVVFVFKYSKGDQLVSLTLEYINVWTVLYLLLVSVLFNLLF